VYKDRHSSEIVYHISSDIYAFFNLFICSWKRNLAMYFEDITFRRLSPRFPTIYDHVVHFQVLELTSEYYER